MMKQMFVAGSALAVVLMTGCAEFMECEHEDEEKCDAAVVAKFDGNWKAERQVFKKGELVSTQTGNASCEMIGKNARISSPELKMELLFGLRQDGKYALVDANASRDRMLVGKYTDDEEEDGDAKETNSDINLKFGEKVLGEIKIPTPDSIEIQYFKEHDDKEIPLETIRLTRIK